MARRRCVVAAAVLCFGVASLGALAQSAPATKPKPAAAHKGGAAVIDADKAGIDYKLQGEYTGSDKGGKKWGAQVIALKKGETSSFRAVFYAGGLPGDGWDGKTKLEVDGRLENDKAVFAEAAGKPSGTADGTQFAGTSGDSAFELKRVVRQSPTMGATPPAGAKVLFDGTSVEAWNNAKIDERGLLGVQDPKGGPTTKDAFSDFSMHIEFILPYMPAATGQGRGNSGVYLQHRYEVQVLDSFGLKGVDNECGGLYKNAAPKVNMCFPPLQWQTYDIDFEQAKLDKNGAKTKGAVVSVKHNGVLIHDKVELKGPTGGGKAGDGTPGPIYLQDHGNPVFYRNIWVVEKKGQ